MTFNNVHELASKWVKSQMFMSELMNEPIIVDIFFDNNAIIKCCFYKGNLYNYRTLIGIVNQFNSRMFFNRLTVKERDELYANEIVGTLINTKVLKKKVIEHEYYRNSNTVSIEQGPRWEEFLKQIEMQTCIPLYYTEDIRDIDNE
jgi:hypothetical protein